MGIFESIIRQSSQRIKESTLSILGIPDPNVRKYINDLISNDTGDEPFLSEPVFEQTCGWETADLPMGKYSGNVLYPEMVKNLSTADAYDFSEDLHPYVHQVQAWKVLTQKDPKSIIVTTGTGSGKTECFMIPIINDLIGEFQKTRMPLVGVRALFLYPLNALINSQRERLNSWTKAYGQNIKYCLYNGNTVERISQIRREQQEKPNEILSRELLRNQPAPILMTNATMLEYMLVRQIDNPIIKISRENQSLRWIVLDEAHTYIGSQAAEISLLLRRVIQAFGKRSKEIRFIATSATISDDKENKDLSKYLANLAGISEDQVVVITGKRKWEEIKETVDPGISAYENLVSIDTGSEVSPKRFSAICNDKQTLLLRRSFMESKKPLPLSSLILKMDRYLRGTTDSEKKYELLRWIDLACETRKSKSSQSFLPLRLHIFQRMLHGLWSCIDPMCSSKPNQLSSWPFGKLYSHERSRCTCGAPVYEVGFCKDCNTPHLLAADYNGILRRENDFIDDDFTLIEDVEEVSESEQQYIAHDIHQTRVIADQKTLSTYYVSQQLDLETAEIGKFQGKHLIEVKISDEIEPRCSECERSSFHDSFLQRCHLGAAFYTTTVVPTLLEHCPDPVQQNSKNRAPEELPGRGRKLLTFTDSRQGTARLALKLQQEAERSRLRGLAFHHLKTQLTRVTVDDKLHEEIKTKKSQAEVLKGNAAVAIVYDQILGEITKLEDRLDITHNSISWRDMESSLAEELDIKRWILEYNKYANPALFSSVEEESQMAKILLLREFIRRPKNQNSLETLGLVKITYNNFDKIEKVPEYWTSVNIATKYRNSEIAHYNLTLKDWKDFLKVILDYYVRDNSFVRLNDTIKNWMGMRFYPKSFLPPDSKSNDSSTLKKWPTFENTKNLRNRMVKLLVEATDIEYDSPKGKDLMNLFLNEAWKQLTGKQIITNQENVYSLNPNDLRFSLSRETWKCPITNRLIDTTFCGLTPYLPNKPRGVSYKCEKVILPDFSTFSIDANSVLFAQQMRQHCERNEEISKLREGGLWSDISDRTLEGGFYYRVAEHSAQQSAVRLKKYEEKFKAGKINVLNCSTTMEMGVDIGGVTGVVMNNVPPHSANYLQRTGRAGRRGESQSIAYTLCKQDAHNQHAFANPLWPFTTAIPAPIITLSSKTIVQRHVNSFMLSNFLLTVGGLEKQNHTLRVGWFFGGSPSVCDDFINWTQELDTELERGVASLTRGTVLSSVGTHTITSKTQDQIQGIQRRWLDERERINSKYKNLSESSDISADDPHLRAIELEISHHESEYLLKELAEKAFLPAYGFPTDVVSFNNYNIRDFINKKKGNDLEREDNIFNYKESPSRSLDIAIREYAPGSTLVIDGRVYRSSGVHIPPYEATKNYVFDLAWECKSCGNSGLFEYAYSKDQNIRCPRCGGEINPAATKKVLRPSGFTQDFYEELGNDVNSQKFIKSQTPRILLQGEEFSLPDSRCGSIKFGEEGSVFFHSSGEYNYGYAICLKCGRAESMSAQNDFPKILSDSYHRPLHGKPNKSDQKETCSKEHVMKNIHLGYAIKTDVIEIFLKNPTTGIWLGANRATFERDSIIATTLAVAIRNAIAKDLGISTSEMGYSFRHDREILTNETRLALQIYDTANGGAGFVQSGIQNINSLLTKAIKLLDCPNNCDNVCSHCLADQDSKLDPRDIDRRLALKWLEESNFSGYLIDLEGVYNIPNAKYCIYGPQTTISSTIETISRDESETTLSLFFGRLDDRCDFLHEEFLNQVMGWRYYNKVKVKLNFIDAQRYTEQMKRSLSTLVLNGIDLEEYNIPSMEDGIFIFCQIYNENDVITLYTSQDNVRIPGSRWMKSEEPSTWITSLNVPRINTKPLEVEIVGDGYNENGLLSITSEFNGPLNELSSKFKKILVSTNSTIETLLRTEQILKIHYSDRYLRSPWNILLFTEIVRVFAPNSIQNIIIETTKNDRSYNPYLIFHDWEQASKIKDVSEKWIKERTGKEVSVFVESTQNKIPHSRVMSINWSSGITTKLIFDQGVGSWKCSSRNRYANKFDFGSVESQIKQLKEKYAELELYRFEQWATYLTIDHTH